MKYITPISERYKHRRILTLFLCLSALISCSKFESLPDRIKSDYEFAIPITDTTVAAENFEGIKDFESLDMVDLPQGTPLIMGEIEYPFYIGDYSSSQEIKWLEPQIVVSPTGFPAGAEMNIKIYAKGSNGTNIYFWLPENYSITLANTSVKIPETPIRLNEIAQFRDVRKIYIDVSVIYPEDIRGPQIAAHKMNIKLGIKFAIKTDLSVNL
ncbi:MAG: hypothetical protein LBH60_06670 [Prevotellaceae bacterium]|jgi:hypothetical protein|nr:hypothetical protein [Prevotellaceae bacterium]